MISEAIIRAVGWIAASILILFLIALVSYMVAYFWTIGQYRGWQFIQGHMKKSTEVTKHDAQKQ